MCVGAHHCLACIPTGRRIHKHPGCLPVPSVGCGHDRTAQVATEKWQVFLENATALAHNLCGAVMTAPYRQRVISLPFPLKSKQTSFFEPILRDYRSCKSAKGILFSRLSLARSVSRFPWALEMGLTCHTF